MPARCENCNKTELDHIRINGQLRCSFRSGSVWQRPLDDEYRVGVFEKRLRLTGRFRLLAYTGDYQRTWRGCCEHRVLASCGAEAKAKAKAEHRERCLGSTTG